MLEASDSASMAIVTASSSQLQNARLTFTPERSDADIQAWASAMHFRAILSRGTYAP